MSKFYRILVKIIHFKLYSFVNYFQNNLSEFELYIYLSLLINVFFINYLFYEFYKIFFIFF